MWSDQGRRPTKVGDPLTPRQTEILSLVARTIAVQRFPPTIREIGAAFNIRSTNGVSDHLRALQRKGMLWSEDGGLRRLRVTDLGRRALGIVDPIAACLAALHGMASP